MTSSPAAPSTPPEQSASIETRVDEADTHAEPKRLAGCGRRIFRTTLLLLIVYVGVCGAMVYFESRLVFPGAYLPTSILMDPNRFTPDEPIVGTVSSLEYAAADGTPLLGRLYVREEAKRVILFLHGNGIHADEMDGWTRRLSDVMDATVLTAEYRGFQSAPFTPTQTSTIEDAVSAIDALSDLTSTPVQDILIYGRSLGGGVAAGLTDRLIAAGTPPKSLILDRTFDSVADVAADMFWFLPARRLVRNRFDSVAHLRNYRGNVVQIHGTPDRIVPIKNGRALHDSLSTKQKVWIEVRGMLHNDRISLRSLRRLREELKRLEGTATSASQR